MVILRREGERRGSGNQRCSTRSSRRDLNSPENVEEQDSVEDSVDGLLHVGTRVDDFGASHGESFHSREGVWRR